VEHDADRLGELVEEGLVGRAEPLERGELDDGLDLPLEEDGHDDDVERGRLPEAARDRDVIPGRVEEEDLLLLERALADEPLAQLELVIDVLPLFVRVAREEL